MIRKLLPWVLVTLPSALAACASGSTTGDGGGTGNEAGAGNEGGAGGGSGQGAVAVLTRVCGPEDCLSYLNVYSSVEALAAEGSIDKSQSREVPYSQGRVYGGSIYLFSRGEQPTVTRWSVGSDLSLHEEDTVSFANTGTTIFCEICNVFGSKDLAFHLDATAGVLVSWNPSTMQIVETSDVPESITGRLEDGYADILFPRVWGGRAFYNAGWSNSEVPEVLEQAAVVTFDADDPAPDLELITDDRCGGTWAMAPFSDADGNVYVMGDWNAGYYQAGVLDPVTKSACLLRIKPGASEFDPDYYVDLLDALDARAVRNAFAMAGGKILVSIWPKSAPALSTDAIEADPWAYYGLQSFRYVVLDLETLEVTPVTDLGEVAAGSATPLNVDDRSFLQIYGEDSADLYEVTPDGRAKKIVNAGLNGDFDMIGRVR